jgi:hypothetical protein
MYEHLYISWRRIFLIQNLNCNGCKIYPTQFNRLHPFFIASLITVCSNAFLWFQSSLSLPDQLLTPADSSSSKAQKIALRLTRYQCIFHGGINLDVAHVHKESVMIQNNHLAQERCFRWRSSRLMRSMPIARNFFPPRIHAQRFFPRARNTQLFSSTSPFGHRPTNSRYRE